MEKNRLDQLIELVDMSMITGHTEELIAVWKYLRQLQRDWKVECPQCSQAIHVALDQETTELIVI